MSAEDGSDQVPTRDISYDESICLQRLLQENRDNAFMVEYMLQAKGSKGEWRIVLIGQHRVFTLKPGGKLSKSIHYLDMKRIESPNETTLVLHCEGAGTLPFRTNKATQALNLINKANKTLFPSRPAELGPRFEVTPASRLEAVPVPEAACDSLAVTYETWCNYLGLAVREDIIWDINNLLAGNVKDFNFGEFENVRDYRPLLFSLAHNQWFRAFRIKSFPVESKTWPHIVGLFALTTAIDELILRSVGVSKDSFGSLFEAITQNTNNIIQVIDVSNNQLDDNSVKALAQLVERMDHGLIELRMRECQGRKKAMKVLAGAFRKNAHFAQTLSVLEMDGSELAADGSTAIASFLSQPNALVRLSLSNTSLKIEPVGAALQRGSQNLRTLNLADNRVTQGDINALALFIQGSENLASLNLDGTQFPVRGLENIIQAIANNYVLGNFSLSLARNGLGAEGAAVLGGLIPDARNIVGLDLSGNSFEDDGVQTLVTGLQSSLTLKRLNLSSNMKKRTATRERAMDAICELIESECPLESLTIRGSGKLVLRDDTLALLDAVGFNKTLTHLDISGNGMGDSGAFSLGKALQLNSTLRSLSIDNNGITLRGFIAFTIGLARNRSLVKMPLPLFDITNAAKGNLDKTQRLTDEMSSYLARNQNPASFTGEDEDGVRRTANVAVSHADEYQKMVLRIRAMCSDEELAGEINTLLEDAEREESVSSRMNLLVEEYHARTQDEVRIRMRAFVEEIGAWVSEQAGEMSGRMLELCGDFQSLADAMPRLERSIEYGSNTFDEDKLKALLDDVHGEMCRISQKPFTSIAQISSSFSYERLSDALDETFQDLRDAKAAAEVAAAEAAREEEEAAAAAAAAPKAGPKPKTKPKPKKKPSKGKGKAKGKAKGRGGASTSSAAGAGAADVAQVEATTPLVSATKSRPKRRGNRRPPTRRPRNRDA